MSNSDNTSNPATPADTTPTALPMLPPMLPLGAATDAEVAWLVAAGEAAAEMRRRMPTWRRLLAQDERRRRLPRRPMNI